MCASFTSLQVMIRLAALEAQLVASIQDKERLQSEVGHQALGEALRVYETSCGECLRGVVGLVCAYTVFARAPAG